MGYVLMWIEALLASFFFSAFCLRKMSKHVAENQTKPHFHWALRTLLIFCASLPLLLCVGVIVLIWDLDPDTNIQKIWGNHVYSWMVIYSWSFTWLVYRCFFAAKPSVILDWSMSKLALSFMISLGLLLSTFMRVDDAVKTRLQSLRGEAYALALSVMPPHVPDSENAAIFYEKAFKAMPRLRNLSPELFQATLKVDVDSNKDEFDPLAANVQHYLEAYAESLAYLRQATDLPECHFGYEYGVPSTDGNEYSRFRELSRVLNVEARVYAARGEVAQALRVVTRMQRLADHTAQKPVLISLLVAISIEARARGTLEWVLNHSIPKLSDFETSSTAAKIRPSCQHTFQRIHAGEQAFMLNAFADIAENADKFAASQDSPQTGSFYKNSFFMTLYRVLLMEAQIQMERTCFESIRTHAAEQNTGSFDSATWLKNHRQISSYIWKAQNMVVMTLKASIRCDNNRNLMILALAMAKYSAQNGAYPEKLEVLVPAFLPSIPIDPYDGKPLKMVRNNDELWLYSVGDENKPLPTAYSASSPYENTEFWRIFRLKSEAPVVLQKK